MQPSFHIFANWTSHRKVGAWNMKILRVNLHNVRDVMIPCKQVELTRPVDKTSPIVFKGVVYNEMKGQMSDSSYLFYQRAQQNMYPGTTYENVSGGDPKHITDLTHEGLVQFQKTFYHPSNSHFYTYGKMPLETHLEAIDAQIRNFDPIKVPNVNKLVTPWNGPREIVLPCAADPCECSE
jgi:hypothetical protein